MNPIHLHTVADLLAHQHTLGLYCHHCDRWSVAPLAQLARDGWGRTPVRKLRFRCSICGGPAERQLRPPALAPSQPGTGWITPPSEDSMQPERRGTSSVEHFATSFLINTTN